MSTYFAMKSRQGTKSTICASCPPSSFCLAIPHLSWSREEGSSLGYALESLVKKEGRNERRRWNRTRRESKDPPFRRSRMLRMPVTEGRKEKLTKRGRVKEGKAYRGDRTTTRESWCEKVRRNIRKRFPRVPASYLPPLLLLHAFVVSRRAQAQRRRNRSSCSS